MKNSAHETLKSVCLYQPQAKAAGAVDYGIGIDTQGFDEALIQLFSGTLTSNGTLDVHVEESDALDSGYADITGAVFAQVTTSNDGAAYPYVGRLNLRNRKRYIRVGVLVANQTTPVAVAAVLSNAKQRPVTQVNTTSFNV